MGMSNASIIGADIGQRKGEPMSEYIDKEKVLQLCFENLPAFWYEVIERKIEELETIKGESNGV